MLIKSKKGFLLVELIIGLFLSFFFISIITHYIIQVKAAQQKALRKIEQFSSKRNNLEKEYTQKDSIHAN